MPGEIVAWVGLGSNEGDAAGWVRQAAERLAGHPGVLDLALSPLYCTRPWGVTDQADFVNAAARLHTTLTPGELLELLLQLEQALGRQREGARRWGPRRIDLDLLLHGEMVLDTPALVLPHPHMHRRAFVLAPMLDLDAAVVIPGHGPARDCLERVGRGDVERLEEVGDAGR